MLRPGRVIKQSHMIIKIRYIFCLGLTSLFALAGCAEATRNPGAAQSGGEGGAEVLPARLLEDKLVSVQDGEVREHTDPRLAEKDYLLIYFGASWCVHCRNFTPTLVEFYNELREEYENFEVILAGEDESAEDQNGYLVESGIPFPAIAFDRLDEARPIWEHRTRTIPGFVLLNADGEVIETSPPVRRPEFFPIVEDTIKQGE